MKLSYLKAALILSVFISAFTVFIPSRAIVAQQAQSTLSSTQRSDANEIKFNLTVADSDGHPIMGLDRSMFTVEENKMLREIVSFESKDVPVSVGILFDMSGSTSPASKRYVAMMLEAIARFGRQSNQDNEYFLIGFNQSAQVLQDWTHDGNVILKQLAAVKIDGNTALYDACQVGLEKVLSGANPKRALLIITDGIENDSHLSLDKLVRSIRESDVLIYSVSMFDASHDSSLMRTAQAILERITGVSGGRSYFLTSVARLNEALEQIASELRHQYSIGFKPLGPANEDKWHSIKIKAQPALINNRQVKLHVRSREGYFPNSIQH